MCSEIFIKWIKLLELHSWTHLEEFLMPVQKASHIQDDAWPGLPFPKQLAGVGCFPQVWWGMARFLPLWVCVGQLLSTDIAFSHWVISKVNCQLMNFYYNQVTLQGKRKGFFFVCFFVCNFKIQDIKQLSKETGEWNCLILLTWFKLMSNLF